MPLSTRNQYSSSSSSLISLRDHFLSRVAIFGYDKMLGFAALSRLLQFCIAAIFKGPDPKAATELIRVDGLLDAIVRHLKKALP